MARAMRYGIPYFVFAVLLALSVLLGACTPLDASQDDATADDYDEEDELIDYGVVADTPPIHLRQTLYLSRNGESIIESNYRYNSDACDQTGEVGSGARIGAQDVGKLGRTFYEVWYQGLQMAVRTDSWDWEVIDEKFGKFCDFRILHTESSLWTVTPDGSWYVDLIAGTGSFNPRAVLERFPPKHDPIDDALQSEFEDKYAAQLKLMYEVRGDSSMMGQPCRIIKSLNMEFCGWTGGLQWGFDYGGGPSIVHADGGTYTSGFSLWIRPVDDAMAGGVLTTELLTIGASFDQGVFNVPPGIKQVPAYGSEDDTDPESDDADG